MRHEVREKKEEKRISCNLKFYTKYINDYIIKRPAKAP